MKQIQGIRTLVDIRHQLLGEFLGQRQITFIRPAFICFTKNFRKLLVLNHEQLNFYSRISFGLQPFTKECMVLTYLFDQP